VAEKRVSPGQKVGIKGGAEECSLPPEVSRNDLQSPAVVIEGIDGGGVEAGIISPVLIKIGAPN